MIHHYKWCLFELENMMPWEREIYVGLLIEHLEEQKKEEAKNLWIYQHQMQLQWK